MSQHGIEHVKVPPGAHAQNGRVERAHLTILNGVRTLLQQTGLPATFWAEAANYIVYCRNRSPFNGNNIPEDLWRGQSTHYDHLQPFGCKLYFRDHTSRNKLNTRYKEGILCGYVEGTTNYRVWDLEKLKIHHTRDVVFTKSQNTVLQNSTVLQNFANLQNHKSEDFFLVGDKGEHMGHMEPDQDTPRPLSPATDLLERSPSPDPKVRRLAP